MLEPSERPAREFWLSVALKLLVIWLIGWALVLLFQGCVLPALREEMQKEGGKRAERGRKEGGLQQVTHPPLGTSRQVG
ncbi:MAG: hypothetical protein K2V38_24690 [Gemmataceae bacterium]|nr:hypothetical protein [Gemmataceae bacterium]